MKRLNPAAPAFAVVSLLTGTSALLNVRQMTLELDQDERPPESP